MLKDKLGPIMVKQAMGSIKQDKRNSIPDPVISRTICYFRGIQQIDKDEVKTISSNEIARLANTSACQVRKDLANFGKFGKPRIGYNVSDLEFYLQKILHGKGACNLALVGIGNLGIALLNYTGFKNEGLEFVAAFDKDESKVWEIYGNVMVEHIDKLKKGARKKKIHIGIITVPANNAQLVANQMVDAGISSILNFAPTLLSVPKGITLRNVDFSNELKVLRFYSMSK